ncbi:LCP family glycopolymer transferase [Virgibacillus sp. W0430]|uniref:LCP family glycopolymer transferase n=1 Tax=Virgibacillus sp. W0430 TaxID=3391580 RepID=UPI003F482484
MESRVKKKQKQQKRKWPLWIGGIIVVFLLLVGGFLYYIYDKIGDTVSEMHDPLDREADPKRQKEVESLFKNNASVNLLLLGVDERDGDKGRSDTMILMSLNPKTDAMLMLSIPRDTYVEIPGHGKDKINHAYAFGGVELSVQTVEENFQIPVHFYSKVNMEGFKLGIDAIDGVTIKNEQAFSQGGHQFPEGEIHLNGTEALDYIRMRKKDPRGDLGRNERQRKVVAAAVDNAASFSSISKVGNILDIVGENVKTDLNMNRMQSLFTNYRSVRNNSKQIELHGTGETINGVWYYVVPHEEFDRVETEIKQHMQAN